MGSTYSSKNISHLGIVSGMIDELGLVEAIDNQLQTDGIERTVSLGTLCKALILNGLGFSQRTLYMVPTFFADKPIELLLGEGIEADPLNAISHSMQKRILLTPLLNLILKSEGNIKSRTSCQVGLFILKSLTDRKAYALSAINP